jgi:hypothetical protein
MKMLNWDGANCQGIDTEIFFPKETLSVEEENQLKRICGNCVIKQKCFEYAIQYRVDGFWAGTTGPQRARMRKDFGIVAISLEEDYKEFFYSDTASALHKRKSRKQQREAS